MNKQKGKQMNYSAVFLFNREDGPYNNAVQLPTTQPFYFPMSDGSRDEL